MAALPWSAAQAATTGRARNPEDIEAEVRKVMAAHAAIKARGFDSIKERAHDCTAWSTRCSTSGA